MLKNKTDTDPNDYFSEWWDSFKFKKNRKNKRMRILLFLKKLETIINKKL